MDMKTVLCAGILLVAVLICGCTTSSQESTVAGDIQTPNLIGDWTGTMNGYVDGIGYTDYSGYTLTLRITEQKDRIFSGEATFSEQLGWESVVFAGVIGRDGRTITMVESGGSDGDGGYSSGYLTGPDEMELIYAVVSDPISITIDVLKKS
ncbi:MAG: hypothetical protein Q7J09_06365 [Methanocalculus sp.]|uniref:hypothetical protein n=1 Tax=Methanocalculus sp. TaxID=2004547 RepID=UPI0027284D36|nr:hypothetical protein [Methanocalculus sp.]MDO9539610.1 hypothetical protein [Methanocalculus sp.]